MISGLNHITISVSNLEASFVFYTRVLEMQPHAKWKSGAYLTTGDLWFCLSAGESHPAKDYTHIAFNVEGEYFQQLKQRIELAGVKQWKSNSSEGDSLYISDPDGHQLELHVGSLQSRLTSLKHQPYEDLILFD